MIDRLRPLWDFDDLDGTEGRLRERLAHETGAGRAEVLTQLARVEGLRGHLEVGELLVEEAASSAGDDETARARIDLERGRLKRSGGDVDEAFPLFDSAFSIALEAGEHFVAADAAHMAALAAPDREGFLVWTERGIELSAAHREARYWLGPLLNNLGWAYYEAGEYPEALDAFERALDARELEPENRAAIEIARYAVGKTLRALGRSDEAVPLLVRSVTWAEASGTPDGWFHEELALELADLGRAREARDHARLALPLLFEADPSFADDSDRLAHLRELAADD